MTTMTTMTLPRFPGQIPPEPYRSDLMHAAAIEDFTARHERIARLDHRLCQLSYRHPNEVCRSIAELESITVCQPTDSALEREIIALRMKALHDRIMAERSRADAEGRH